VIFRAGEMRLRQLIDNRAAVCASLSPGANIARARDIASRFPRAFALRAVTRAARGRGATSRGA
jgi:hypothetical protein